MIPVLTAVQNTGTARSHRDLRTVKQGFPDA